MLMSLIDSTLGGTIGISVGGAIYASEVKRRVASISGFAGTGLSQGELQTNVHALKNIQVSESHTRDLSFK